VRRYRVRLSSDAEDDLFDIYSYIAIHDSVERADHVLDELEALCSSLTESPFRGHVPPELDRIGMANYREVHFKPYRVIYEVSGRNVFVHCVLDGRRDMQSLLERRLLR
jgi:toxin ParE1/3/4